MHEAEREDAQAGGAVLTQESVAVERQAGVVEPRFVGQPVAAAVVMKNAQWSWSWSGSLAAVSLAVEEHTTAEWPSRAEQTSSAEQSWVEEPQQADERS